MQEKAGCSSGEGGRQRKQLNRLLCMRIYMNTTTRLDYVLYSYYAHALFPFVVCT